MKNLVRSLIVAHALLLVASSPVVATAATIASGEAPAGAISSAGELDEWTFTASSGNSIVLRIAELTDDGNGFDPKMRLYAPDGTTLLATSSGNPVAEIAVTVNTGGTFILRVTDGSAFDLNGTGTYRLQLATLPGAFSVPDDGGPLTNGQNHDGAITIGDLDLWSFTATKDSNIVLRISELTDNGDGFDPKIRLYGPAGELVTSASGLEVAEIATTAPSTGTFTVMVIDGTSFDLAGTGTYRLQLAVMPGDFVVPDDGGSLTNGQNHDATITQGDLDLWSFTASKDSSIVLRIAELTDNGDGFDPKIRLYGPAGELVTFASGLEVAEIAATASISGTYTVMVTDGTSFDLAGTGTYRLQLAVMPGNFVVPDDGGSLTNGQNHDGTITQGDLDLWSFTATKDSSIVLRIAELTDNGDGFDPKIRLYGPAGDLVTFASGLEVAEIAATATSSGTYTVMVTDGTSFDLAGTGTYRLQLAVMPGNFVVADDGGSLTSGQNHDGTITQGDLDRWSFTASQGSNIVLRIAELTDNGNGFDPKIRVYGPAGELVTFGSGLEVAEITATATSSGTFTVLVTDGTSFDLAGTGTYRLQLAVVPGDFVVADDGGTMTTGQNHDGTITQGDLDPWRFGATAGDSIVLRISELSDDGNGFDPRIRLYAPNGTLLGSASNASTAELSVTAGSTGLFTVLVTDGTSFDLAGTGNYRLTVLGAVPCTADHVCRAAVGDCDAAEFCIDYSCPADDRKPAGTPCPSDLNPCTNDTCSGVSNFCQYLAANAGAVCRAGAGICDVAETCTGTTTTCPSDIFTATSTVCRAAAGACDAAEHCTGSLAACPADLFASSATVCRSTAGVCDVAETCTGASAACPVDGKSTASCRAAAGVCDLAETCDGVSNTCPADLKSNAVCRASAGICDLAETCNGTSASCPVDALASSTVPCRSASGECDVAEKCSGSAATCPANAFRATGSACGDGSDAACDHPDTCDGSGVCAVNLAVDGTSCDDSNTCTTDQCIAGACESIAVPDCPIVPIDPAAGDEFGSATALTSEYLVVGASASKNSSSGRVHVFMPVEGQFVEQTQTTPIAVPFQDPDHATGDQNFGAAVDVDRKTIVVGAPFDVVAVGNKQSSGSASVFFFNGTSWVQQAKLVDATGLCTQLGTDVAISGDTIVLGAPGGDCALVFQRSGSAWSLAATLSSVATGVRFGRSVDVSGDSILVGAPGAALGVGCSGPGAAYAFHRNGETWSQEDTIDEPVDTGGGACFGSAVAIDGATGVVGAPFDDSALTNAGAAYVVERTGAQWDITEALLAFPTAKVGDGFGGAIDIRADVIIVGAPGVAAYLFQQTAPIETALRAITSKWESQRTYLPPSDSPAALSKFAFSVAVVPGKAAIGAPSQDRDGLNDAGAVYPSDSAPAPSTVCGNGVTSPDETCDDGDTTWKQGQHCDAQCKALACGDTNDSGKITSADALFALKAAVGISTCDLSVCDATGNGKLTTADALLILKKAVGGVVTLACP